MSLEIKRILILDDNEDILEIVQEVLSYENYEVKAMKEAGGFMTVVREFRPQLLLLDFKLRDGNGGELCRTLKADPDFGNIPVIIFSAYTYPNLDLKAYGCDAVIAKPFNLEELTTTVAKFT